RRLYIDSEKELKEFKFAFRVHHPDIQSKPVTVRYGGKNGILNEVIMKDRSWKNIEIPVTEDYLYKFESPLNRTEWYFVLSLDVSRTWVPKEWGVNNDPRELGVAVWIGKLKE
ncbi:MAG: hypothetical protein ACW99L_18805, partial [Promethearchaeota archaeon]